MDIGGTIEFLLAQPSRFADQQQQLVTGLSELRAVVLDLTNAQARTNEIVAVLAERQVATEENLNALISTVERHIVGHS
jgi:hypothetical protein